jgi:hypothetical protein
MPVLAEQNDPDFLGVHVERNAEHITGKSHQFLKTNAGKAGNLRNAGGDTGDRAHLPWPQLRRKCVARTAHSCKRTVDNVLQAPRFHVHGLLFGLGSSA